MVLFILSISIALTISFMCSILEACLLSVSNTDIAQISERRPAIAAIWIRFKDNIQKPIAVILIVNTLAHTIGATISGAQFSTIFGPKWIAVYSLVFSFVMIQWAEILPKTLAVRYNIFFAQLSAIPLSILIKMLSPIVWLTHVLNRPFESKKEFSTSQQTLQDISVLTRFAALNNVISKEQESIVSRGISLSRQKVKDIMVKKGEMMFLTTKMSLSDALLQAHIHHHTRFPLVDEENRDEVIGYVNFKDIVNALRINAANPTLRGICRPMITVNENDDASALLAKLTRSYQHIAIVIGALGTLVGLVTLEDVIESIVGEINDEYDILPDYCYPITDTRFVVGGGLTVAGLIGKIGVDIPETASALTLNDWLLSLFNHNPKAEDKITYNNCTFIVRKVRRSQMHEIIVEKV